MPTTNGPVMMLLTKWFLEHKVWDFNVSRRFENSESSLNLHKLFDFNQGVK